MADKKETPAEKTAIKPTTIIIIFVIIAILGAVLFYFTRGDLNFVGKFYEGEADEICSDLEDNDGDSLIDCADPDCNEKACDESGGCMCISRQAREVRCWDQVDNDGDGLVDTEDPNCI